MASIAKKIIDNIYSEAIAVEMDWKNCKDNHFRIISRDAEGIIDNRINCFELSISVSSVWTHTDGYSASLNPGYYRLESNEQRTEFLTVFKQMCVDIHNKKIKSEELKEFI